MKRRCGAELESFKVHRCKFLQQDSAKLGVTAIGVRSGNVAVARNSGQIDLFAQNGTLLSSIPGVVESPTIRGLHWVDENTLLSTSLSGEALQWDIKLARPVRTYDSFGGPIWASSMDGSVLVFACEDGTIRIFDFVDTEFVYRSHIVAHRGRISAIQVKDDMVYSAGVDGVMNAWDVSTTANCMRVDVRTTIWALSVAAGGTLTSGDEKGQTCFWDISTGTLLRSHHIHKAPVLSVVVSESGTNAWSSGIDSAIIKFELIDNAWKVVGESREHVHDVLALDIIGDRVVSCGISGRIVFQDIYDGRSVKSIPNLPMFSPITTSNTKRLLFQEQSRIQLWELSSPGSFPVGRDGEIISTDGVKHLLDVNINDSHHIWSSALSPDGRWFACSTPITFKLFRLDPVSKQVQWAAHSPASLTEFSSDSQLIATVSPSVATLTVSCVVSAEIRCSISLPSSVNVRSLALSKDTSMVAYGDSSNQITIVSLSDPTHVIELPRFEALHNCIKFTNDGNFLVIGLSSNEMFVYDLSRKCLSEWSQDPRNAAPDRLRRHPARFNRIILHPTKPSVVLLETHQFLCHVDFSKVCPIITTRINHLCRHVFLLAPTRRTGGEMRVLLPTMRFLLMYRTISE